MRIALFAAVVVLVSFCVGTFSHAAVKPFDLTDVHLLDGPLKDKVDANRKYILSLDADRLLHVFRLNAKLPTTAQPLGGWEKPDCELRGHFVGHYLSGCALMYQAT